MGNKSSTAAEGAATADSTVIEKLKQLTPLERHAIRQKERDKKLRAAGAFVSILHGLAHGPQAVADPPRLLVPLTQGGYAERKFLPEFMLPEPVWERLQLDAEPYGVGVHELSDLWLRLCHPDDLSVGTVPLTKFIAEFDPRFRPILRRLLVAKSGGNARMYFEDVVRWIFDVCAWDFSTLLLSVLATLRDFPAMNVVTVRAVTRYCAGDANLDPLARAILGLLSPDEGLGEFHSPAAWVALTARYPTLALSMFGAQRSLQRRFLGVKHWRAHAVKAGSALFPETWSKAQARVMSARVLMLEAISLGATPCSFGSLATEAPPPTEVRERVSVPIAKSSRGNLRSIVAASRVSATTIGAESKAAMVNAAGGVGSGEAARERELVAQEAGPAGILLPETELPEDRPLLRENAGVSAAEAARDAAGSSRSREEWREGGDGAGAGVVPSADASPPSPDKQRRGAVRLKNAAAAVGAPLDTGATDVGTALRNQHKADAYMEGYQSGLAARTAAEVERIRADAVDGEWGIVHDERERESKRDVNILRDGRMNVGQVSGGFGVDAGGSGTAVASAPPSFAVAAAVEEGDGGRAGVAARGPPTVAETAERNFETLIARRSPTPPPSTAIERALAATSSPDVTNLRMGDGGLQLAGSLRRHASGQAPAGVVAVVIPYSSGAVSAAFEAVADGSGSAPSPETSAVGASTLVGVERTASTLSRSEPPSTAAVEATALRLTDQYERDARVAVAREEAAAAAAASDVRGSDAGAARTIASQSSTSNHDITRLLADAEMSVAAFAPRPDLMMSVARAAAATDGAATGVALRISRPADSPTPSRPGTVETNAYNLVARPLTSPAGLVPVIDPAVLRAAGSIATDVASQTRSASLERSRSSSLASFTDATGTSPTRTHAADAQLTSTVLASPLAEKTAAVNYALTSDHDALLSATVPTTKTLPYTGTDAFAARDLRDASRLTLDYDGNIFKQQAPGAIVPGPRLLGTVGHRLGFATTLSDLESMLAGVPELDQSRVVQKIIGDAVAAGIIDAPDIYAESNAAEKQMLGGNVTREEMRAALEKWLATPRLEREKASSKSRMKDTAVLSAMDAKDEAARKAGNVSSDSPPSSPIAASPAKGGNENKEDSGKASPTAKGENTFPGGSALQHRALRPTSAS